MFYQVVIFEIGFNCFLWTKNPEDGDESLKITAKFGSFSQFQT